MRRGCASKRPHSVYRRPPSVEMLSHNCRMAIHFGREASRRPSVVTWYRATTANEVLAAFALANVIRR
jgi:hypothetical protein